MFRLKSAYFPDRINKDNWHFIVEKMHSFFVNATEFDTKEIKCIEGKVPIDICGNYFRNGSMGLNYGENTADHWFDGEAGIIKLSISNGKCTAEFKYVDNPLHRQRAR